MCVDDVLLGVVATGHRARAHVAPVLALVAAVRGSLVSGFRGIVPNRMMMAMNWASVTGAAGAGYCHQRSRGHRRVNEQQPEQAHACCHLLRKGAFAFDQQIHLGADNSMIRHFPACIANRKLLFVADAVTAAGGKKKKRESTEGTHGERIECQGLIALKLVLVCGRDS